MIAAPFTLHQGDCLEALRAMPDNSVDAVVSDPPYGLSDHKPIDVVECLTAWIKGEEYRPNKRGFMGRTWDSWVPGPEVWREVYRVLKPGGHVVAFAGSRTHDLMSIALRLAGFECRDTIMDLYSTSDAAREFIDSLSDEQRKALATAFPADTGVLWTYGSGFPKSMDVSKALDKAAGAEREVLAEGKPVKRMIPGADQDATGSWIKDNGRTFTPQVTAPATDAASQWQGWGTALKPAFEPALLFRKPLIGNVAENVLTHGTGAINIDGCRVPPTGEVDAAEFANNHAVTERLPAHYDGKDLGLHEGGWKQRVGPAQVPDGRFPANVIHDGSDEVVALFPESTSGAMKIGTKRAAQDEPGSVCFGVFGGNTTSKNIESSRGSAARFFYCAKASRKDRNEGLVSSDAPAVGTEATMRECEDADWSKRNGNHHPTVKPTELMAYLVRLVTPPGGVVLDPFMGSGSTGKACMREGFRFIGCELSAEYVEIARARIYHEFEKRMAAAAANTPVQPDLFSAA